MAVSGISSTSNYYTQAATAGPASIATALAAIKANARTKVSISDSTENIARNLDSLRKIANNITAVSQTDASTAIDVTASQWAKLGTLLGKFSTNYQLRVSGVTAANAANVAANSHVASFSVSDNSANISEQLATGLNHSKLSRINITNPTALINVSATHLIDRASVVAKLSGNYNLAVTEATAEQAVGYAGNLHIKSVAILDSVSAISSHLDDLQTLGLRLKEVRGSDGATFEVTAEQVQTDALVIGKLYKGYQLSVLGASMDQAQTLVNNKKVVKVDIVDTAANLSANLNLLKRLGSDLNSIHVTDADTHALSMSSVDYGTYAQVLSKILADDDYTVDVNDASVCEAQTLLGDSRVASISVTDTSAAIGTNLHALQLNGKLSSIRQTGKPTALEVGYAQLNDDASALNKIQGNYSLSVSGVSAADALSLAASNAHVTALSVSDTGSAIIHQLSDLAALGKRLTQITQSDNTTALNLSVGQWASQIGTLSKITGGYSLALSGVNAARAQTLLGDSRVRSVAVSDSAAAISAHLDSLHHLGAQLTGITQTDTNDIALTASQWSTQTSTLAKLGDSYTLAVRNAQTVQLSSLLTDTKVKAIAIADTSTNIASKLDALQDAIATADAPAITVRQTGTASPMAITASQLTRDADALALIAGNYSLAVSGVSAADAASVGSNSKVASMMVSDTGANLVDKLADLASLGAKVRSLSQSDAATEALNLSASQWASYSHLFGKISTTVRAHLSEVKASGATALLTDARVASVAVSDSATQISAHLDNLQGLGTLLTAIDQSDSGDIGVTMNQLTNAASTLGKINGDYTLAVRGASVSEAQALLGDSYTHVASVAVSDTSANIAAGLDALQANSKLTSITPTGTAAPLNLNKAQLTSDADALTKIRGSYSVAIQDASTDDVSSLSANARVASMAVTGSASQIVSKLAELQAAGNKVKSLRLENAPATLDMSHAQWTTYQPVLAKISPNYSVTLSGVSASQAATVASDPRVASLTVSDSTARINASLDALQSLGAKLNSIAVTDSGTPPAMSLSASQYFANAAALAKIADGNYSLVIRGASLVDVPTLSADAKVTSFAVADSSSNIAASLGALNGLSQLSAITQAGSHTPMTLSASVFSASTATLAKVQSSYSLNIENASTADAAGLQANSHVLGFTLNATTSEVSDALPSLSAMGKLGDIQLSADDGPITVTSTQLETFADTLDALKGAYRLVVTGVTISNLASVDQNPSVSSMAITSSSEDFSQHFDELLELGNKLSSVTLSTPDTPIALTHAQWQQGSSTLSKLQDNYLLALVDVRAQDAAGLLAQDHVDTVSVSDTAGNISSQFEILSALGDGVDAIELTDDNPLLLTQAQYDAGTVGDGLLTKIVAGFDHEILA